MHLFCLCRELSQQQRLEEEKDRQRRKREVNAQVHERRRTTVRLKQYYDKYAGRGARHHKLYSAAPSTRTATDHTALLPDLTRLSRNYIESQLCIWFYSNLREFRFADYSVGSNSGFSHWNSRVFG